MPAYIPVPEGLELPDQPQFDMPVTFEVRDNMLYALAVNGMPVPKKEEEEGEEMEEEGGEMEEEGGNMDFMSAVESAMKKPQPK